MRECYETSDERQKKQPKKSTSILIGINFSPDYSFHSLTNNDGSSSTDAVIKNRNSIEIAKFGFTTGIDLCIDLSQSLAIETGIQFSNKGYKTKALDLLFAQPDPSLPINASFQYSYQYVGIPVKARFTFGKNKLHFISGIGFMTNILIHQNVNVKQGYPGGRKDEKNQSSTSDYKKIDISPMVSFGLDYTINNKLHLIAEPVFRYGVIKTRDAPVTEHLWSAGFNCGIYYRVR